VRRENLSRFEVSNDLEAIMPRIRVGKPKLKDLLPGHPRDKLPAVPVASIAVKNRAQDKLFVAISKGLDGGGQTSYFGIKPGEEEVWERAIGSKVTVKFSTAPTDKEEYERKELTINKDFEIELTKGGKARLA
jgi:hypothetical protein